MANTVAVKCIFVSSWFCILMIPTVARTLCPRIFFQNIEEDKMPYKGTIEGVFVKQSYTHNGFPVYKRENDKLLFYYHNNSNIDWLRFGTNLNDYFGVSAEVSSYVTPLEWLASSASLNRDNVFSGLISDWYYWNDRDRKNYDPAMYPQIKAICVEDDFRECNSDRVYLNVTFHNVAGNILTNANTDYFSRMPEEFRNLRPVYKHNKQPWYLQYTSDQYWIVTKKYKPTYFDYGSLMRVNDVALRPEYITKTWSVHYNDGWRDKISLKVKCRGIGSMINKCPTSPCRNGSTCVYTSGNETLCICASGYIGVRCDIKRQCPTPQPHTLREINFYVSGNRPGDLAMTFCRGNVPSYILAICVVTDCGYYWPYWKRQGQSCTPADAIAGSDDHDTRFPKFYDGCPPILMIHAPSYAATKMPVNNLIEDDSSYGSEDGLFTGVIICTLFHIFMTLAYCCYLLCMKWDELSCETFLTSIKGCFKKHAFWKLISKYCHFSFVVSFLFPVVCNAPKCRQPGNMYYDFYVACIVMMVIAITIIFIECEYSYLQHYKYIIANERGSWWIRPHYFWLATLLFMSWPYRIALDRKAYSRPSPSPPRSRTRKEAVVLYEEEHITIVGSD